MPPSRPFLVFSMSGVSFAMDPSAVREILWLPEITPIAEAPPYIIGVINLRGRVMPVMDLKVRLGQTSRKYSTTNSVIITHTKEMHLGLIVDEVRDVVQVPLENIELSPFHDQEGELRPHFVTQTARVGKDILMILDHLNLLKTPELMEDEARPDPPEPEPEHSYFCPQADEAERAIFHKRALHLMEAEVGENLGGLLPMAIVGLSGEYFGVELDVIREFCGVFNLTPVPCCPPHVMGNMNLRGSILTLIDVRSLLNLPGGDLNPSSKVIVACMGDLIAGVVIDELLDVVYLDPDDIAPVPSAVRSVSQKFFKGTAPYENLTMTILDLPKILMSEELIVHEEP